MSIENTSNRDAALHVLGAMSQGPTGYIEGMEQAAQTQIVHSDLMPVDGPTADLEALGFTFGDVVPNDDLFRKATLPAGWKRQGSDHAMWSHIVDERGIKRVAIFYKGAFYDRSAHASIESPGYAFASKVIYGDGPVTSADVPWDILTDSERSSFIRGISNYLEHDKDENPKIREIYAERMPRARKAMELWAVSGATS